MKYKLLILSILITVLTNYAVFGQEKKIAQKQSAKGPATASATVIPLSQEIIIDPEKVAMISEKILDAALKRLDNTITIFGILMSLIVIALGVTMTISQYTQKKDLKEKIDEWTKTWEKRADLDRLTKDLESKLAEKVGEKVESLFESRYRTEIHNYTKSLAEEVLMMTPQARGLLVARLRNMDRSIKELISDKIEKKLGEELFRILGRAIEDWHTIGQLHSVDRKQLEAGLLAVRANPFQEAEERLTLLKRRYLSDGEIYPMIVEAMKAVNELNR